MNNSGFRDHNNLKIFQIIEVEVLEIVCKNSKTMHLHSWWPGTRRLLVHPLVKLNNYFTISQPWILERVLFHSTYFALTILLNIRFTPASPQILDNGRDISGKSSLRISLHSYMMWFSSPSTPHVTQWRSSRGVRLHRPISIGRWCEPSRNFVILFPTLSSRPRNGDGVRSGFICK